MKPESGMLNHPRVKQVFRIIRHRHTIKTGVDSNEVAYGITSLPPRVRTHSGCWRSIAAPGRSRT